MFRRGFLLNFFWLFLFLKKLLHSKICIHNRKIEIKSHHKASYHKSTIPFNLDFFKNQLSTWNLVCGILISIHWSNFSSSFSLVKDHLTQSQTHKTLKSLLPSLNPAPIFKGHVKQINFIFSITVRIDGYFFKQLFQYQKISNEGIGDY